MSRDVLYATTEEGVKLAVIDVTNPAFAVAATEAELSAMAEQYILEAGQQQEIPDALREALRNSMLGRGLMAATGTFLDGMSTYVLKLGPENLGAEASPIDKRIAASFPAFTARLRLQDMARLLAEGLGRAAAEGAAAAGLLGEYRGWSWGRQLERAYRSARGEPGVAREAGDCDRSFGSRCSWACVWEAGCRGLVCGGGTSTWAGYLGSGISTTSGRTRSDWRRRLNN